MGRRTRAGAAAWFDPLRRAFTTHGEKDSAFVWLDRAAEQRNVFLLRIKVEPIWDHLRSDPRYAALLRKMRLPI